MKEKWFEYSIQDDRTDYTAGIINADSYDEAVAIFKKYYSGCLKSFIRWSIEEFQFENGIKEVFYG